MSGAQKSQDGELNSSEVSAAWWRNDLWIPFVAGIFLMLAWCLQRGWIVADHNVFLQSLLPREWIVTNHKVSLACLAIVYVVAGWNAFLVGLRLAIRARLDVDFLMVVAAIAAAWIGEGIDGGLLLFLFSLGNALEHYAMGQSRKAIRALGKLAPKFAKVKRGVQEIEIAVEQLVVGDVVVVRPGERLPADGIILAGSGSIDQSPINP
jgi:cation transport ATPase